MEYKINSKKITHPIIKPMLESLIPFFDQRGIRFFVIGATARDIILEINGEEPKRKTADLDIAIAVENWGEYEAMANELSQLPDFDKDDQKQRFRYRGFELDIVPFGGIMKQDQRIYWPPEQTFAMNVLGFEEAEKHTIKVMIDENIEINVVSLAGIFLLKLIAWEDRFRKTNKDADDLGFIIQIYLDINDQRAAESHYDEVYGNEYFTKISAAGTLLGIDVKEILKESDKTKKYIVDLIEKSLLLDEDSILINQIIETNRGVQFEDVKICLENFKNQLEK